MPEKKLTFKRICNAQLGYLSLQQRLSNDEVLAVAYEYTIGGISCGRVWK
jgi:cell surface protein SprA